ncbi:hypothetical protein EJ110_NYTH30639 [Nymphaea thermarum]|nr:hypothetical protein EJ110_NYTH30639 [Nymphaea thermarum]
MINSLAANRIEKNLKDVEIGYAEPWEVDEEIENGVENYDLGEEEEEKDVNVDLETMQDKGKSTRPRRKRRGTIAGGCGRWRSRGLSSGGRVLNETYGGAKLSGLRIFQQDLLTIVVFPSNLVCPPVVGTTRACQVEPSECRLHRPLLRKMKGQRLKIPHPIGGGKRIDISM